MTIQANRRTIAVERAPSGAVLVGGKAVYTDASDDLLRTLAQLVENIQKPQYIMTLNVDQLLQLQADDRLYSAFEEASIRTLDGMPVLWLARVIGKSLVSRNTGADLLYSLSSEASRAGWRVAVTGGGHGVAELAAHNLRGLYPRLEITALDFPQIASPDDEASQGVIDALRELKPDFVFLCLGCPKQEKWYASWSDVLPPAVYIGSGAAIDFAAGVVPRAPQALQRLGFEWAWRLAHDPRRLAKRYLVKGPLFMGIILRSVRIRVRGRK